MGRPSNEPSAGAAAAARLKVDLATRPSPAKVGKNTLIAKVLDAAGQPLSGAEVEVRLFMPQMGAMAPMEAKATLRETGGGQYTGDVEIPMAWSWDATVTVRKAGQVVGTTQTTITAR
jgi:hypothetical protein